jgi:hypothetical protein
MAENSSKSDQIRNFREARALASEKIAADREADAKRIGKSIVPKKQPEAHS